MQITQKTTGKTPDQMEAEFRAFVRRLPHEVGNIAVLFFKDNITERQGFKDGGSVELWERSRVERFKTKHLLHMKGNLVRGINYNVSGMKKVTVNVIGIAAKYAEIHNNGGTIQVTPKMRKFFWAMYYKHLKASERHFKPDDSLRRVRTGRAREKRNNDYSELNYWNSLALAKKIVIPKRKFIGNSTDLDKEILEWIEMNLDYIFNG